MDKYTKILATVMVLTVLAYLCLSFIYGEGRYQLINDGQITITWGVGFTPETHHGTFLFDNRSGRIFQLKGHYEDRTRVTTWEEL